MESLLREVLRCVKDVHGNEAIYIGYCIGPKTYVGTAGDVLVITKTPASVLIKSDLEKDFCHLLKIDPQATKECKELSGPDGMHSVGYYVYEVGDYCHNLLAGHPLCVAAICQEMREERATPDWRMLCDAVCPAVYQSLPYVLGLRGRAFGLVRSRIKPFAFGRYQTDTEPTKITGRASMPHATPKARLEAMREAPTLSAAHPARRIVLWVQAVEQLDKCMHVLRKPTVTQRLSEKTNPLATLAFGSTPWGCTADLGLEAASEDGLHECMTRLRGAVTRLRNALTPQTDHHTLHGLEVSAVGAWDAAMDQSLEAINAAKRSGNISDARQGKVALGRWVHGLRAGAWPTPKPKRMFSIVPPPPPVTTLLRRIGWPGDKLGQHGVNPASVLFATQSGSFMYDLHTESSDADFFVVYLGRTLPQLGLHPPPTLGSAHVDAKFGTDKRGMVEHDTCELGNYIKQLCRGNPRVLEFLFVPERKTSFAHPLWTTLLGFRRLFITKRAIAQFFGFMKDRARVFRRSVEASAHRKALYHSFHKLFNVRRLLSGQSMRVLAEGHEHRFIMRIRNAQSDAALQTYIAQATKMFEQLVALTSTKETTEGVLMQWRPVAALQPLWLEWTPPRIAHARSVWDALPAEVDVPALNEWLLGVRLQLP